MLRNGYVINQLILMLPEWLRNKSVDTDATEWLCNKSADTYATEWLCNKSADTDATECHIKSADKLEVIHNCQYLPIRTKVTNSQAP